MLQTSAEQIIQGSLGFSTVVSHRAALLFPPEGPQGQARCLLLLLVDALEVAEHALEDAVHGLAAHEARVELEAQRGAELLHPARGQRAAVERVNVVIRVYAPR